MAFLDMKSVGILILPFCLLAVAVETKLERVPGTGQQRHHHSELNQSRVWGASYPADEFGNTTATPTKSASLGGRPSTSTHDDVESASSSRSLCVHKVSTEAFDGLTPVTLGDTSGRVLLWNRRGLVFLGADKSISLLIDLSGRVRHDGGLPGMISVAMDQGGRLFVSYTTVTADNSPYLVIEELLSAASADEATRMDPSQTRRIFSVGLTLDLAEAERGLLDFVGQTLWSNADAASLYLATAGPGPTATEFQGKIVRIHVNNNPGDMPIQTDDIFAIGVPRSCSFDSDNPDVLYCASIDTQQQVQVVYAISISNGQHSVVVAHERPADDTAPSSFLGGLIYRGSADTSLFGSYIYIHNSAFWVAVETPPGSRQYTATQITVTCAHTSPYPCLDNSIVGSVAGFAEDGIRNAYVIAGDGLYRVVAASICRTTSDDSTNALEQLHLPKWAIALLAVAIPAILGTAAYTITCYCCNRGCCNREANP